MLCPDSLLWYGTRMDRGDRNQTEGDRHEPGRFTFLPHALEDMEERNVTEELVRAPPSRSRTSSVKEIMAASSRIAASGEPWYGWSTIWAAGSM